MKIRENRGFCVCASAAAVLISAGGVTGQSLYQRSAPPPATTGAPSPQPGQPVSPDAPSVPAPAAPPVQAGPPSLQQVSLIAVNPPKPREFAENDLVTIIVSERSSFDRNQKLDSKKEYDTEIGVDDFLDIVNLLETRFQQSSADRLPRIGVSSSQDFKGDGKYSREDKATARVTARVLEVKPNRTLVLEAKSEFVTDKEEQVILLSGLCRADDITDRNTVQSNQLFDMKLNVQNKGEVFQANKKGLIPQILETIFNF